jgi:hypothetical protein
MGADAPVRYCTVADASHFVGLVALVNSLRWNGHHDPVTVLDAGLTPDQRADLAPHCDVVASPPDDRHPWLLAPLACRAHAADVVVSIDCDVIVTAPLDDLLRHAREGQVCAFPDWMPDRWFAEWESTFALPRPPRHQTYVNSGFVAFSPSAHPELLERWVASCDTMASDPVVSPAVDLADPTALPDQDALNALLMSIVDPTQMAIQPAAAAPQGTRELARTRVTDVRNVSCSYDGTPTALLHSWGTPKPWQQEARNTLRRTAYLVCLRRLLVRDDVAWRSALPRTPWLVPGFRGALAFRYLTVRAGVRRRVALWLGRSGPSGKPDGPLGRRRAGRGRDSRCLDARAGGP